MEYPNDGKKWTRRELLVALNIYLKLPFGKLDRKTPEVAWLAQLLGRTPNSASMRLNNFASVDPYHQKRGIKGLTGGINQVQPIWDEFINNKENVLYESELILTDLEKTSIETKYSKSLKDINHLKGETKERIVKVRINQNVFRQIVLANYSNTCAISGINISGLLVASHILPWSHNEKERLNPENGICLSALYDLAFDKGLIGIDGTFKIRFSKDLKEFNGKDYYNKYFGSLEGSKINLPQKYLPNLRFLELHLDTIFKR